MRGAPQSVAHRLEFERHYRINRGKHTCGRCFGDLGKAASSTEAGPGKYVAGSSDSRSDNSIADMKQHSEHSCPPEEAIADETLRANDGYKSSIGAELP